MSVYKYILDRPCKYTYDKHMIIKIHPEVYVLCKKLIKGSEREREMIEMNRAEDGMIKFRY